MNDLQNYASIVEEIFGANTSTFDVSKDYSNEVIGALNHADYSGFKANFIERLKRLKALYSVNVDYLRSIVVQVNEIARKNWEGAFAELSALDYLNQNKYIDIPIVPNVTIDKSKTFAMEVGKHCANLDGYIPDIDLYFEIKTFKDNVNEILKGVFEEVKLRLKANDIHISAGYDLDVFSGLVKAYRKHLIDELIDKIKPGQKRQSFRSTILPGLHYNILFGSGILTTESIRGMFAYAEKYHVQAFDSVDQFLKDSPNLLVYVIFPWYNQILNGQDNREFYRAFCRRVFCQYTHDDTKFNALNPGFSGSQTISDVSKCLSGIIFLEDNSILSDNPEKTNVKSFVYLNPNSVNSIARPSLASAFIVGLHPSAYDDFENDNY